MRDLDTLPRFVVAEYIFQEHGAQSLEQKMGMTHNKSAPTVAGALEGLPGRRRAYRAKLQVNDLAKSLLPVAPAGPPNHCTVK